MKPAKAELMWSKSQVAAFRDCRRKGILTYWPSKKAAGTDAAPLLDRAQQLKKLKNRYLWSGSMVHEAIGRILRSLSQGESLPEGQAILEGLHEEMRQFYVNSRAETASGPRLFEHEYELKLSPEVWQRQWAAVEMSLRWFFESPWLKRMKALGPEAWKAIDEILEFDLNGIRVYCKMDCALEVGKRFILIDWKTSSLRGGEEKNLYVPALYAREVWDAEPDAIEGCVVSLWNGESRKVAVQGKDLADASRQIQEEARFMQGLLEKGRPDPLSVPSTSDISQCWRCNFQKLCHPKPLSVI